LISRTRDRETSSSRSRVTRIRGTRTKNSIASQQKSFSFVGFHTDDLKERETEKERDKP
jgi:hypothetical protein